MSSPREATLPAQLLQELIDAARAALPNECVGLLVGSQHANAGGRPARYLALENADASPFRYRLDDRTLAALLPRLEGAGEVIWGIVHSHVASLAVPSSADLDQAFYPDSLYLICSLAEPTPQVRAWSIRDGEVSEVSLLVG